jgi:exonuclease SbcD
LRPDLVVIAGDVFHTVRPSNQAILTAFTHFSRLKQALGDTPIVMVAGNHDLPRSSESGSILRLFAPVGIEVVEGSPRRVSFPDNDLSVFAVPYGLGPLPKLDTDPSARYNVLLVHGLEESKQPPWMAAAGDRPVNIIRPADLFADQWSYIALGHYHVHSAIEWNGQRAFYSGSIDYSSSDPWGELLEAGDGGKGLVEHDLDTGAHTFHALKLERAVIDLPELWASGLTAAELDERIRERVEAAEGGIDHNIVRLLVRHAPRHIVRELNQIALREYKRRALHFHLDTRRPEITRLHGGATAPGRRPSLADVVREKLTSRVLESDIDRAALVELGLHYLREAETLDAAATIEGQSA